MESATSMITSLQQLDPNKRYSYADYLLWRFKERVELLKGRIFKMSPAPSTVHQRVVGNLYFKFRLAFDGKRCEAFIAPFDVRLPLSTDIVSEGNIHTVVQPDLCVVCDASKLDAKGCLGAPDLVVEVLSPGNSKKEMQSKYRLYEEAGVKEYWIVDPERRVVFPYVLDADAQKFVGRQPATDEELLKSSTLDGFEIPLSEVFPSEEEKS